MTIHAHERIYRSSCVGVIFLYTIYRLFVDNRITASAKILEGLDIIL